MYLERLVLQGFQSFGPVRTEIRFDPRLTAFVGTNGVGKTSANQALLRMFSVVTDQRHVRVSDFHVPHDEDETPPSRQLRLEAIFGFPELDSGDASAQLSVPEFFRHMTADDDGSLRVRIVLEAEWTDDGTLSGSVTSRMLVVYTFDEDYGDLYTELRDRARIQAVYVPATRDGAKEVAAFLRGRIWRAGQWSSEFGSHLADAADELATRFQNERVVTHVTEVITDRWQELHHLTSETNPKFQPISRELHALVTNAEMLFEPSPGGRRKGAAELSDGQRSLLHIALTAATLDLEDQLAQGDHADVFDMSPASLPALTLLILEEPENNLSPFFLSRVVQQLDSVAASGRAQALISSHSSSVVTRLDPERIRHFRLRHHDKTTCVREILLPVDEPEAEKYVRQAVRAYPELYFARFVVLGEGESESVVIPRLAEARGIHIDQSFVAVVPLGGRHTHHFWKLLTDLDVPHATLLDLDWGRAGGGKGRLRYACQRLQDVGVDVFANAPHGATTVADLDALDDDPSLISAWLEHLETFKVFYSSPLDLDMSLLRTFFGSYSMHLAPGERGPSASGDPREAVLGETGVRPEVPYWDNEELTTYLRWYRYLFLTKSKPSRHLMVLSHVPQPELAVVDGGIGNLIMEIGTAVGDA